jgi:hypothetical protein
MPEKENDIIGKMGRKSEQNTGTSDLALKASRKQLSN